MNLLIEDLSSFELEKCQFNGTEDAKLEGVDTFVLEQVPTDKNSGYTHAESMARPTALPPNESRVYGPQRRTVEDAYRSKITNSVLKNQYWRAHTMAMQKPSNR